MPAMKEASEDNPRRAPMAVRPGSRMIGRIGHDVESMPPAAGTQPSPPSYGKTMPPPGARSSTPRLEQRRHIAVHALTSRPTRRAASRIDTGPAPQRALSNSSAWRVSTCHNSSGLAKLIRVAFSGLPVLQARTKIGL